jgi:hypothetical protein
VKRGVWAAGGILLEFPTVTLGKDLMKRSAMLYRNLMAMTASESYRLRVSRTRKSCRGELIMTIGLGQIWRSR